MALYFEDFTPGRTFQTGSRAVSAKDISAFAEVSGDRNPLHLDAAFARRTHFGGPIAHGALGIAIATGLLSQAGLTTGTLIALVAIEWQFKAPVRPGDVLTMKLTVAEQRPTRQPDRGVVRFNAALVNQGGEVVQEGTLTEVIRKKA